jgi:O-antigen/teichoic acid export membrane protein
MLGELPSTGGRARMPDNLKGRTATALVWSAAQSWSVKVLTLLLFMVLARYLSPAEMGVAATVMLALAFVAILAEQGFPEVIIQRPNLRPSELNLPFALSIAFSVLSGLVMWVWAEPIARLLRAEAAAPFIAMAAAVPPLAAMASFQTAMRKRQIDFRTLASVTFTATVLSGLLAIAMALAGQGAASIVAQVVVAAALTAFLLWRRPAWRPTLQRDWNALRQILGYSAPAFGARLVDFFGGRLIELIVLGRFGLVGLGLYTVGAKLYQTLLQLLASTLTDVALTSMSKIAADQPRLMQNYLRFLFLAACTTLPLFVGVAVLSPELCRLLFGNRWAGVDDVARWLCLLGAIQTVQFFNGSLLGAVGRIRAILLINLAKTALAVAALGLAPSPDVAGLTFAFVVSQLISAPLSFGLAIHASRASIAQVVSAVAPGLVCAGLAYAATTLVRTEVLAHTGQGVVGLLLLAVVFAGVACGLLLIVARRRLFLEGQFLFTAWRTRKAGATP